MLKSHSGNLNDLHNDSATLLMIKCLYKSVSLNYHSFYGIRNAVASFFCHSPLYQSIVLLQ